MSFNSSFVVGLNLLNTKDVAVCVRKCCKVRGVLNKCVPRCVNAIISNATFLCYSSCLCIRVQGVVRSRVPAGVKGWHSLEKRGSRGKASGEEERKKASGVRNMNRAYYILAYQCLLR